MFNIAKPMKNNDQCNFHIKRKSKVYPKNQIMDQLQVQNFKTRSLTQSNQIVQQMHHTVKTPTHQLMETRDFISIDYSNKTFGIETEINQQNQQSKSTIQQRFKRTQTSEQRGKILENHREKSVEWETPAKSETEEEKATRLERIQSQGFGPCDKKRMEVV